MKDVYEIAGITKQAHSKEGLTHQRFNDNLQELVINVDALRKAHPGCGVEKMYQTLQPDFLGRDKFIEVMMDLGYRVKRVRNYRRTTFAGSIYYPNLIEGMLLQDKNQLWQSDITYIEMNRRFYYLVMIIDVYTRQIVGYALSNHMRTEANIRALKMAIRANRGAIKGLIHHSDRGSQYSSKEYIKLLQENGIVPSMGLKGQENAYAEKLNDTIKNEFIIYRQVTSELQLTKAVQQAVTYYNKTRIHNELPGRISPNNFAQKLLSLNHPQRPTVIVYAEGNQKVRDVSNIPDFLPHKDLRAHVCPINYN